MHMRHIFNLCDTSSTFAARVLSAAQGEMAPVALAYEPAVPKQQEAEAATPNPAMLPTEEEAARRTALYNEHYNGRRASACYSR